MNRDSLKYAVLLWVAAGLWALACTAEPGKVNQPPANNRPPSAVINAPLGATEGAEILFDASGSSDPEGGALSYVWDFGDHRSSTAGSARHTYPDEGGYIVTLTVRDAQGAWDADTVVIQVVNVPPVFTTLKAHLAPLPTEFAVPVEIVFFDPGLQDRVTAHIEWGDGGVQMLVRDTTTLSHMYQAPGRYTVTVTASDEDGGVGTRTATIDIFGGYEVIDLGTLGGSIAVPLALNDKGQVVGYSTTTDGTERAFLWENGSIRDLNVSAGSNRAQVITNSGIIAGATDDGAGPLAFRWANGLTTILGSVNDHYVVGITATRVLISTHDSEHAPTSAVWDNGVWRQLTGVGYGGFSVAKAMNSTGQIVGGAPVHEIAGDKIYHPFVWQAGVMRDLGLLQDFVCSDDTNKNCGYAWAMDINGSGDVIGYGSGELGEPHALLWPRGGTVRDLGPGTAVAINEAGEIAGAADWSGSGDGFFWRQGSRTILPSLGSHRTVVADLNDLSMVVGSSGTAQGESHVFVWTPERGIVDLGAGLSAAQANAVAINARGDIIGFTCHPGGAGLCWPGEGSRAILWRVKP